MVHERTTNQKTRAVSAADGSFSLELPAGFYDVGLDGPTATSFYGPVAVQSATRRDLIVQDAGGRSADLLWGRISTEDGSRAAGRPLRVRPRTSLRNRSVVRPQTTSTDGSGGFQVALGSVQEAGLDLEIYDTEGLGKLTEFVDLAKRAKPCYAEFSLSPVKNRLRYGQNDGPRPASANLPAVRLSTVNGNPTITQFALSSQGGTAYMQGGSYPPQAGSTPFALLVAPEWPNVNGGFGPAGNLAAVITVPLESLTSPSQQPYMAVDDNGDWWYTYAVTVGIGAQTNDVEWVFTDSLGGDYSLSTDLEGSHQVSYNSDGPAITQFSWTYGGTTIYYGGSGGN